MPTRATYKFATTDELRPSIIYYFHTDGDPEGAACKLRDAVAKFSEGTSKGLAESFLIANPSAEFIESHKAINGTEFRYSIHQNDVPPWKEQETNVTVESAPYYSDDWKMIFTGTIERFLSEYAGIKETQGTERVTL